MSKQDDEQAPEEPSAVGRAKAAALGTSTTPPPGTPKRIYFFAAAPDGKVDAKGVAEHVADLGNVLDAARNTVDGDER